jgi:hypothetical protein
MGADYRMPDLNHPFVVIGKVLEVDGVVQQAAILRIEFESMMWVNRDWGTTEEKIAGLEAIQSAGMEDAKNKGLEGAHMVSWVPATVEKAFAPHLKAIGWDRDREEFHTWSRKVR